MSYSAMVEVLGAFPQGISECASCPVSGGRPIGCYAYVSYPIDEAAETCVFKVVLDGLSIPGSPGSRFYHDTVNRIQRTSDWVERRGAVPGSLCTLAEPLTYAWVENGEERLLNSADLLAALFVSLESPHDLDTLSALLLEVSKRALSEGTPTGTLAELVEMGTLVALLNQTTADKHLLVEG
ncbi:MAG: hypothetical protein IPK82_35745 [Polyangiaceae bacterium]|nr:hypothetical protein [Polyangiaceae bacterium]